MSLGKSWEKRVKRKGLQALLIEGKKGRQGVSKRNLRYLKDFIIKKSKKERKC